MNSYGREKIGIGFTHDSGRGAARRQSGNIDALRIDIVILHDLSCDTGDERRLAVVTGLVAWPEPVPTLRWIGGLQLLRVNDKTAAKFIRVPAAKSSADCVHPCSMTIRGLGPSHWPLGV
jgi:hypothetical protein